MYKKNKLLTLLIILFVLVGIYLLVDYTSSEDRTFRPMVTSFEQESITKITIRNPGTDIIEMIKEGDSWDLYEGNKKYSGEPKAIANSLELLNAMSTESIVATRKEKWVEYKVDEEQAIIVKLFAGDDIVETLYIGKFGFKQIPSQNPQQQQQTKMTSYVRTEDDVMVYAIDGILRMNFQEGVQSFRNRTLFICNDPDDISKVTISSLYDELVLDLSTAKWTLNGIAVDSMLTARYIQGLARTNSTGFVNDVNIDGMAPAYTMVIEGNTFEPVTLKAYPADTVIGHYITSTFNPGSVFDGSKARLFEKTFVGKEKFLGN